MTEEPIRAETEWVEAETPFEKKRKRITYQCPRCEHIYVRTFAAEPKRDPPCPNRSCVAIGQTADLRRQVENLTRMLQEQRAPAQIGTSVKNKAIEETSRITMEDNHLTDLRDNLREGDIAAPKLPGKMQASADGFFAKRPVQVLGKSKGQVSQAFLDRVGRRAIAGSYKGNSVAPNLVLPRTRPGANLVGSYDPRHQR